MKVAHRDVMDQTTGTVREMLERARGLELQADYDSAISIYHSMLKKKPLNEAAYTRLMIVFRKLKNYQKELVIIDQAIRVFEENNGSESKKDKGKIGQLSMSLGKLTGLIDKKGKSVYDPEPIATWRKRRVMAQKRLKTITNIKKKK